MPVRRRFARSGLLERADAGEMLAWHNSGFSADTAVRIGGPDRAGPELLLVNGVRLTSGSSTDLCRHSSRTAQRQQMAGQRPSTRRSTRGVRERAVTDPERTLAL